MLKKKTAWKLGDYFCVPLSDRSYALAQVISVHPDALNSVVCAFFLVKGEIGTIDVSMADVSRLLSVCFVTRDLLDSGVWSVVSVGTPLNVSDFIDVASAKRAKYVDITVRGSGVINKFMDACYGLFPWNGMHDKQYFDKMLVDPNRKAMLTPHMV